MAKIKIVTDSASDIPKEIQQQHNIDIRCFPITVGDKSFKDRDIPMSEYYKLIDESPELPVHSQLTIFDFEDMYTQYDAEGTDELFFVSINSHGSATYSNACAAKEQYKEDHPDSKMNIRVIDSGTYTGTYGYPVVTACEMAENGSSADEIEAYLTDWFDCCEVYLAAYTLRFVKKSGRISAAAAFAGELIGLKPIILLTKELSKVVSKARGDANVVPNLAETVCERIQEGSPYVVVTGQDKSKGKELAKILTKKLGYPPVDMPFEVGGAVSANTGPDCIACAFKAKK